MARSLLGVFPCLAFLACTGTPTPSTIPDLQDRVPVLHEDQRPAVSFEGDAEITLDDLLAAADRHPDLLAAGHEVGAALARADQASLYPNPSLELETEEMPAGDPSFARAENSVAIVQPVVVGGRRDAASRAARAEAESAALSGEARKLEIEGEVRETAIELVSRIAALDLYRELHSAAARTLEVARRRHEARAAPESEAIRTALEIESLDLASARAEREARAAAARLSALLGGVEIPVERLLIAFPSDLPALDLARLRAALAEGHPEVESARREAEAARGRAETAEAERIPDLEVRVAYARDTFEDEDLLEAGLTVPLPVFDRNQGKILEARHDAARAEARARGIASRLEAELARAHEDYETARLEAAAYATRIVPEALRALEQIRDAYQGGSADFLDLLDAQRTWIEARIALLDRVTETNLAEARLRKILGARLGP